MSTFDGIVDEFPNIRIDYFQAIDGRPNPLACFLSHVHSDHTRGLQSLRSPFVYCSSATREILLNIERYSQRINFSKGIVETREKTYRHLQKVLRPIPLGVPTEIPLTPQEKIRVTLFDANHCPGSVMFLIEGANGKAILYTGDVRAEKWWVDSLIRYPVLLPYTLGNKVIDTIYLDTTFATHQDIYRNFPSKAQGISELLSKVSQYPYDTLFYLRIRTFGYEDVWQALSAALNSKVHVDRYQWGLFAGLCKRDVAALGANEGAALCGFTLGNEHAQGCLSKDGTKPSRVHSCDPLCPQISSKKFVILKPIVNRIDNGVEVPEVGLGGGQDDLFKTHELELAEDDVIEKLKRTCADVIRDPQARDKVIAAITSARVKQSKSLILDDYGVRSEESMNLDLLLRKLGRGQRNQIDGLQQIEFFEQSRDNDHSLPDEIRFPFSRHASYSELCDLVRAFKPRDVIPCTVYEKNWSEEVSMQKLFGELCSGKTFRHDQFMRAAIREKQASEKIMKACLGKRPRMDSNSPCEQMTSSPLCESFASQLSEDYQKTLGPSEPKRQKTQEIHSSFEHSPSQVIDLTTPDIRPLDKLFTPISGEHWIDPILPTVTSASQPSISMTTTPRPPSNSSQESLDSLTKARKRVAKELKKLRDQGHLEFQLVTDSCATVDEAVILPSPTLSPSQTECDTSMVYSHHSVSQTCIPCSFPSDVDIVDDDVSGACNQLVPDNDDDDDEDDEEEDSNNDEPVNFSFQFHAASQSQKSMITLSTANFESQGTTNTTDSTGSKPDSRARREQDVEDRKRAYRAVRAGTFEDWAEVYQGPYIHEEEV
ncbi:DNA repair protein [Ascosphaera apis ARSEF 7405]|uniref:DNA repair protein n=1 Tax=Ascosphaera apis ARSEF 7405 TaxID=392613 RepID=A0A162ISR9_9EURO|nr:DNA repair protein [Ascosphaera apis ARSEF 7405]